FYLYPCFEIFLYERTPFFALHVLRKLVQMINEHLDWSSHFPSNYTDKHAKHLNAVNSSHISVSHTFWLLTVFNGKPTVEPIKIHFICSFSLLFGTATSSHSYTLCCLAQSSSCLEYLSSSEPKMMTATNPETM